MDQRERIEETDSCEKPSDPAAASVPTVTQGDVKAVANVGFPIFMVINWLAAGYIQKNPDQFEEKKTQKGKRLKKK